VVIWEIASYGMWYVWVGRKLLLIEPHKPLMYDGCIPQLVLGNDAGQAIVGILFVPVPACILCMLG